MESTILTERVLKFLLSLSVVCFYSHGVFCQTLQEVSVDSFFVKGATWEKTLLDSRERMFNCIDYGHVKESATDIISTEDKIALVDKYPEYTVIRNQWTSFWRKLMTDYPEVQCDSLLSTLNTIAGCSGSNDRPDVFYISQKGNDKNNGSRAKPFKTFNRARLVVRKLIKKGLKAPVNVIVREGKYLFAEPFHLGLEDSGTKTCPVSWGAAPNERVVLSGNSEINSEWKSEDDRIFYTDIHDWSQIKSYERNGRSGEGMPGQDWHFRQLFINGERQTLARYPNNDFLLTAEESTKEPTKVYVHAKDVKESWGDDLQGELFLYEMTSWFNTLTFLKDVGIEREKTVLIREGYEIWGTRKNNRYFVYNLLEELDTPGEWYLDYQKGRLYYYPADGTMKNKTVEAPITHTIIEIEADVEHAERVSNISITGFYFDGTDYTTNPWGWRTQPDATVVLQNVHHISLTNNFFNNIGGYAIRLYQDCLFNRITNNEISNAGGGGVIMTGSLVGRRGSISHIKQGSRAHFYYPILNLIQSNHIHHGGVFRKYVAGVTGDPRNEFMIFSPGNVIAHNQINDMPRCGVFLFQNTGGDVIDYNYMYNLMLETNDGGGIHLYSSHLYSSPSQIRYNILHDIGLPNNQMSCRGIYLDGSINRMLVENNVVYNIGGRGSAIICTKGIRNSFLNNIFVNSWTIKTSSRAYYDYQVFKQNICVNTSPYSEYYVDNRNTITLIEQKNYQADMDSNLVWMGDKPILSLDKDKYYGWEEWQATGWEKHSLVADPMLIDMKRPYLGVKAGSPAFELGFKQIDMDKTGLLNK